MKPRNFDSGVSSLLCVEPYDVEDHLAGFFHTLEREVFHLAVEVMASGEDIRARESHE